jgi:ribonuclease-3
LEFLGDAVLDLILSETLMTAYPEADEGTLSKWRASLVNESSLSEIARAMNLGTHLRLGRSETMNRELSQDRPRILASAFEAVIAALYQDAGLEKVRAFINAEFAPSVAKLDANIEYILDFKTRLQEWAQKKVKQLPEYRLLTSQGPEHAKTFRFEVWIGEEPFGQGEGSSRKAAEQDAARAALVKIGEKV